MKVYPRLTHEQWIEHNGPERALPQRVEPDQRLRGYVAFIEHGAKEAWFFRQDADDRWEKFSLGEQLANIKYEGFEVVGIYFIDPLDDGKYAEPPDADEIEKGVSLMDRIHERMQRESAAKAAKEEA